MRPSACRRPVLLLSDSTLETIRLALETGMGPAVPELVSGPATAVVHRVAACRLADFPQGAVPIADDMLASLVIPLGGRHAATAVLSLEPETALELLQWREEDRGPGEGPVLDRFIAAGSLLARHMLTGWPGESADPGAARMEEDSLTGTLLRTHAPGETVLVSAAWQLAGPVRSCGGSLVLLLDAKALSSWAPEVGAGSE